MITCGGCGKEMPERKNRNGRVKKFCSDRCRWEFHNRKKYQTFQRELVLLLRKYGYLKDDFDAVPKERRST